jgi:hypothetical protein
MQQQNSGTTQGTQGTQGQQFHGQGIFPVSNEDYNLVQCLASELKGLEAFQKYQKDGQGSHFWQDAMNLKRQLAELFTHELAEHAKQGHFGTGEKRSMQ